MPLSVTMPTRWCCTPWDHVVAGIRDFDAAVERLAKGPSDRAMEAAAQSWKTARARWQAVNTFAYGPCAFYDFDKQVASWPIDRPMIEYAIAQVAAGRETIDARSLREKKLSTLRGFFTAEYLLFEDGKVRSAGALTPERLAYLKAVSRAMLEESLDFKAAWAGTGHMNKADAALLSQAGSSRAPPMPKSSSIR